MTDILIADPHPVFCEALRSYLTGIHDGIFIKTVCERSEVKKTIEETNPALMLIGGDFYDPRYFKNHDGMRIAVLVDDPDDRLPAGTGDAPCVFLRSMSGQEWVLALSALVEGGASNVHPVRAHSQDCDRTAALTKREREVLPFLVQSDSNKEIARALGVQEVTVKLHVRGICRKLGAKNRTQAALRAREEGW